VKAPKAKGIKAYLDLKPFVLGYAIGAIIRALVAPKEKS